MNFEVSGIPDAFRTLVVVPVFLADPETIRAEVEKLEIRYLANKEGNLLFGLFTDYTDSDQAHRKDDERLLQTVTRASKLSTIGMGRSVSSFSIGTAPGVNLSRIHRLGTQTREDRRTQSSDRWNAT